MKLNLGERLFVNSPLRLAMQRRVLAQMLAMAELKQGAEILEIGCGRGEGGRLLARILQPERLFLMDLDPTMAALAKGKGGTVLVGDAEALPLAAGRFDAVFGFGFLHHAPRWQTALAEAARVLRPGGVYYLEEYYPAAYQNPLARMVTRHPTENRFRGPELLAALAAAGFKLTGRNRQAWWGLIAAARKD